MNQRIIKFRAWDKENSEWYKPTYEAYNGKLFDLHVSFSGDLVAHTMRGMEHESVFANRFQIMQYTGLKDKNGVEIYEGDIVKFETLEKDNRTYVAPVEYSEFSTKFSAHVKGWDTYQMYHDYTEVIGNIYENPNLIK